MARIIGDQRWAVGSLLPPSRSTAPDAWWLHSLCGPVAAANMTLTVVSAYTAATLNLGGRRLKLSPEAFYLLDGLIVALRSLKPICGATAQQNSHF